MAVPTTLIIKGPMSALPLRAAPSLIRYGLLFCHVVFGQMISCLLQSGCSDCQTGDAGCAGVQCDIADSHCLGIVIEDVESPDVDSCLFLCKSNPECFWWSFDGGMCTLTRDCATTQPCSGCTRGQKFCGELMLKIF